MRRQLFLGLLVAGLLLQGGAAAGADLLPDEGACSHSPVLSRPLPTATAATAR